MYHTALAPHFQVLNHVESVVAVASKTAIMCMMTPLVFCFIFDVAMYTFRYVMLLRGILDEPRTGNEGDTLNFKVRKAAFLRDLSRRIKSTLVADARIARIALHYIEEYSK